MTGNWAVLKCCHWASAEARLSLKLSREQKPASQWMASVGFQLVEEVKLFEDKFFVIFSRNP